jgi:hypothetical protein
MIPSPQSMGMASNTLDENRARIAGLYHCKSKAKDQHFGHEVHKRNFDIYGTLMVKCLVF